MKYESHFEPGQIEMLTNALRCAMQSNRPLFVMMDLGENAISVGSGKKSLVEFVVNCMMSSPETADLLINVVMNYISNRILQDVCGNCDKSEACGKKQSSCDPENLYGDIKSQLEVAMKLMKIGKN